MTASTNDVIAAVQDIVVTGSATTGTPISESYTYIPTTMSDDEVVFVYQEAPADEVKFNNMIRRTYKILVWCLVQYVESGNVAAEARFNDLTDAISLALQAEKTLHGVVRSSDLENMDHNPLVEIDKVIYRVRIWCVSAFVDISVAME